MRLRDAWPSVLGGLCLALAYPPYGLWPLSVLTFVLLGRCFSLATSAREALVHGWIVGALASLIAGRWLIALVPRFTVLPRGAGVLLWLLVCVFSGSSLGFAGALTVSAGPRAGRALGALVGVFVSERWGLWVFPLPLAAPLVDAPFIAQSADLFGVQGLGAALTACSVLLFKEPRAPGPGVFCAQARLAMALTPVALLCAYGAVRQWQVERALSRASVMRVALVQPAIGAAIRWDPEAREAISRHLQRLTSDALSRQPDLVVWHEAAFPYVLPYRAGSDGESAPRVLSPGASAPLLFGAIATDLHGGRYNAAFVRSVDGRLSTPVAKRVRLLFGEYIPLVASVPWVRRAFARVEGLRAGARPEKLPAAHRLLGVLNCLEDTVPSAGAEVADAELLVNITNDAWFDGAEASQHLLEARWRSIETRREMVRAVNPAMSGHIDALGRVVELSIAPEATVLLVRPRVGVGLHPWAPRAQRGLSWAALLCAVAFALDGARRHLSAKAAPKLNAQSSCARTRS